MTINKNQLIKQLEHVENYRSEIIKRSDTKTSHEVKIN